MSVTPDLPSSHHLHFTDRSREAVQSAEAVHGDEVLRHGEPAVAHPQRRPDGAGVRGDGQRRRPVRGGRAAAVRARLLPHASPPRGRRGRGGGGRGEPQAAAGGERHGRDIRHPHRHRRNLRHPLRSGDHVDGGAPRPGGLAALPGQGRRRLGSGHNPVILVTAAKP